MIADPFPGWLPVAACSFCSSRGGARPFCELGRCLAIDEPVQRSRLGQHQLRGESPWLSWPFEHGVQGHCFRRSADGKRTFAAALISRGVNVSRCASSFGT